MIRLAVVAAAVVAAGCQLEAEGPVGFADTDPPDVVRVTEIAVDEYETLGYLEVEVHLYDADTGERLGCVGEYNGLDGVDDGGISYQVLADFITPGWEPLRFDEVVNRSIVVSVTERDNGSSVIHCPEPPDGDDDEIGTSEPVDGGAFDPALGMQFGAVIDLVIGTSRTRF